MIRRLDWDSAWFGFEVGRVEGSLEPGDDVDSFEVVYWLCDDSLTNDGFHPIDVRAELVWEGTPPAMPADLVELRGDGRRTAIRLAERSFTDTRFTRDPRFPRDRVDAMYGEWVRKAATVFATPAGDGFVTVDVGVLGLIAVAPERQGQGIGRKLIQAAQSCGSPLRVVTQGANEAARCAYERAGFRLERSNVWYHRWRV